jgi:hypothetical protein
MRWEKSIPMRTIIITLAAIALLTVSARAQQSNNPNTPGLSLPTKDNPSDHTPDEHSNAPKVDERAYRSALDGIPQIKGSDPWHSVREAPKSKSAR